MRFDLKKVRQLSGYAKSGLARLLAIFSQFALIALIGNYLGVSSTGVYATCFSFASIVAIVIALGQIASAIKEMPSLLNEGQSQAAANIACRAFQVVMWGSIIFALPLTFAGASILGSITGGIVAYFMGIGFAFLAIFSAIARCFGSVFLSETIKTVVWRVIAIMALLGSLFFDSTLSIFTLLAFTVVGMLGSLCIAVLQLVRVHNIPIMVQSFSVMRQGWKVDLKNWSLQSVQTMILNIDVILVGALLGFADTGVYFVLTRMASLVSLPLSITNPVVLPAISRIAKQGRNNASVRLVRMNSALNLSFAVVIIFVLWFGQEWMFERLSGGMQGADAMLAFIPLLVSQFVNTAVGPTSFSSQLFNVRDEALVILIVCLLGMAISLCIGASEYGLVGAAIAVAAWRILQNIATFELIRRRANFNMLTA